MQAYAEADQGRQQQQRRPARAEGLKLHQAPAVESDHGGATELGEALNGGPRVAAQLRLGGALNGGPRAAAQMKLAQALSHRGGTPPQGLAVQRQAAPPGGVLQRQIKVGLGLAPKEYSVDAAMSELFRLKLINDVETAGQVEEALRQFHKAKRSFSSFEEMLKEAMDYEEEEEDVPQSALNFPMKLWRDDESLQGVNLKQAGYVKGDSLREEQGMNYKTVDKDAFEVVGKPRLALVIRFNRPPGAGTLTQEMGTLTTLKKAQFPTAKLFNAGYYPIGNVAYPAMLMQRYESSSKTIVRRVKGEITSVEGWEENIKIFDDSAKVANGLESLTEIKSRLKSQPDAAVDDIQFLIGSNGTFVINDASEMDKKYLGPNLEVIDALKERLTTWGKRLKILEAKKAKKKEARGKAEASQPPPRSELSSQVLETAQSESNLREGSTDPYISLGGGYYLPNLSFAGVFGDESDETTLTDFIEGESL